MWYLLEIQLIYDLPQHSFQLYSHTILARRVSIHEILAKIRGLGNHVLAKSQRFSGVGQNIREIVMFGAYCKIGKYLGVRQISRKTPHKYAYHSLSILPQILQTEIYGLYIMC